MRLMKVFIVVLLLGSALAGLTALDLDYHVGAGLAVPFIKTQATIALPQAYAGLGVNIIPELAVGAEYEVFGFYLLGYGFLMHLPKVYAKFDMNENFTASALGGVAIPTVFSPESSTTWTEGNVGFAGVRATLFFIYGEYLFLVNQNAPVSLVSVGVAIKR